MKKLLIYEINKIKSGRVREIRKGSGDDKKMR